VHLINNKINTDVIILGSSRSLNGIDPATIEKETNLTCSNLSYSGSNILFHETVLDLVLQSSHQPKTIIYNIDDDASLVNMDKEIIYKETVLYPYVDHHFINQKVAECLDKNAWITTISSTYRNNINFLNALKYLSKGVEKPNKETNNIGPTGANLMEGYQKGVPIIYNKRDKKYLIKDEHKPYKQALLRIISKCKAANIELILTLPPVFYTNTKGFKERIKELNNDSFILVDYSTSLKENELFYNHGHLNKKGALKYSKFLSQDLMEK